MNKPAPVDAPVRVVTALVDEETARLVRELAEARGQSPEAFAAEAIRRVVESEADFRAFLQAGIDAADRGDLIPHEEVMAELDTMIAQHRVQCRE